jgi:putative endonuclease
MLNKRQRGESYEALACEHLRSQGLRLVDKNYHAKCGEIDLIMKDKHTIVFVEVKFRQSSQYGLAQESVNRNKQRKIIKTAQHWLLSKKLSPHTTDVRFDVIAIQGDHPHPKWIKSAFYEG